MWDTVDVNTLHLTHDRPCPRCGHPAHRFLACSESCTCVPPEMPGETMVAAAS